MDALELAALLVLIDQLPQDPVGALMRLPRRRNGEHVHLPARQTPR